ncbi:hypothetical protein T02_15627 [Trichinella nativa]|uniref:Uncharacterized protein n=1 Tax=Trichinella nativa TaxID=6335 RepID=A0A0V1LLP2_9BILA|nr:hypothetical protein T02_15627 [Trichinella nativa]
MESGARVRAATNEILLRKSRRSQRGNRVSPDQSILSARDIFGVAYNSSKENTPRPPHNLRALMKSVDASTRSWKQRFTSLSIAWLYPLADCLMLLNLAIIS